MEKLDAGSSEFTWMSIDARHEDGSDANSKWFVDGVVPTEGQEVKIVFVGYTQSGAIRLMLKGSEENIRGEVR